MLINLLFLEIWPGNLERSRCFCSLEDQHHILGKSRPGTERDDPDTG